MKLRKRPMRVLIVDDEKADVDLFLAAIRSNNWNCNTRVVSDGVELIKFLREQVRDKKPSFVPDLIFLDINMPRMNGLEVLGELKKDSFFNTIPVVVITNSTSEDDILESYRRHANGYINKPTEFADFSKITDVIGQYWGDVVTLPTAAVSY